MSTKAPVRRPRGNRLAAQNSTASEQTSRMSVGTLASLHRTPLPRVRAIRVGMVALACLQFLLGCSPSAPEAKPSSGGASTTNAIQVPTAAQPKLPTLKLLLGAQEITAELARTDKQWQTGMMFRTAIGEQEGMLFVFPTPHQASFYMKNTSVALSCAYIDPEGTILELHDLKPFDESPVPAQSTRIQYVLETAQGWFTRHQVGVGTVIRTERGSLGQTFFGRP